MHNHPWYLCACRSKDGFPGVTQVWKAEEGDLNSPKLQSQRETLPQLQKDPLQLQLDMDTLIVEISEQTPLVNVSGTAAVSLGSHVLPGCQVLARAMLWFTPGSTACMQVLPASRWQ